MGFNWGRRQRRFPVLHHFLQCSASYQGAFIGPNPLSDAESIVGPSTWHVCCRIAWLGLQTAQVERKCGILWRNEFGWVLYLSADSPPHGRVETAVYVFGIIVYLSVTIPGLRAIATPTTKEIYNDQVMALRVLSAGNVIIIGCLLLILSLQVSGLREIFGLFWSCGCRLDRNGHVGRKPMILLNSNQKKRKQLLWKRKSNECTYECTWNVRQELQWQQPSKLATSTKLYFFSRLRNISFLGNAIQ